MSKGFACAGLWGWMLVGSVLADDWQALVDSEGRDIEARILGVTGDTVSLIRKSDGRRFEVPLSKFSEESGVLIEEWQAEEAERAEHAAEDELSKKLYPRTRQEIKDGLREIGGRQKPGDIDSAQHETITELNIYRFLSGVPYDVEADPTLVENATEAAEACAKAGELSHDLGSYTDKCNISTLGDIVKTPRQYINDPGANNRERRGHRRWCLNPPLQKTGFGSAGKKYSAMWALGGGGERNDDPWGYPGRGFFPIERLHGNGWTLYLTEKAPNSKELEVEVYEMSTRPEDLITWGDEVPGRALPVDYVSTYQNAINFEPDAKPITERGIYYVRISGGGVREQYLVELY
ncbi:MAG: hypothetical protein AAF591_07665 [Verrucomicrobiota bacterium]